MTHGDLADALRGVAFTNPTPFTQEGDAIDHDALRENIAAITDAGGEMFVPCGNTGEYYALSHEERIAVVETVVDAVGDDGCVLAGAAGSTKTVLELAAAYEDAGADGLMVMHPDHTYLHERGLRTYYRRIIEGTDLGVVLYKRGHDVPDRLLVDLVAQDDVVGVKYAVNDVASFSKAVSETVEEDVVWVNGIAERYAIAFDAEGAEGFTTGIGNFVPREVITLMDALRDDEYERAKRVRDAMRPYEDLREESGDGNETPAANNVPAVKFGLELAGLNGGPVREPLVDLSEHDTARAREYYSTLTSQVEHEIVS